MQAAVPEPDLKTWFAGTSLKQFDAQSADIEVPNKFVASWLREQYEPQIRKAFQDILRICPQVRYTYPAPSTDPRPSRSRGQTSRALRAPSPLNAKLTFETFVRAASNRFAYSAAVSVATLRANRYNPLYIYSPTSSGKTHLLHAVGHQWLAARPHSHVAYVPSAQFLSDMRWRHTDPAWFNRRYGNLELLLFDDIQGLAGRQPSQEAFAVLFNRMHQKRTQMVIAARSAPGQIADLIPALRSRLESGLLAEILLPEQETKMRILKRRAREDRVSLPEDVAFFLAGAAEDAKAIEQYLVSLQTYMSLYQRQIDMSTVKAVIRGGAARRIELPDIQRVVAEHFSISHADLLSSKKHRRFSYPRQIAMYLSRHLTSLSFKEIGRAFGNKDHSTVIYAVNRIRRETRDQPRVKGDIRTLQRLLTRIHPEVDHLSET